MSVTSLFSNAQLSEMHAGTDRLGGMFLILEILKTSSCCCA